jgi:hypothetical protein
MLFVLALRSRIACLRQYSPSMLPMGLYLLAGGIVALIPF